MKAAWLALAVSAAGCGAPAATGRAPAERYATTDAILYTGTFYDLRAGSGGTDGAADGGLAAQREVRIPVGEIRSVFAGALDRAGLFERVLNPPAAFAGETPDEVVARAQRSSDYVMVAEVNQLHIKSVGLNENARLSVPLDVLTAPITLITYFVTAGNQFLFTGSLIAAWNAEVVLTMSVSLVDAATGDVAHTVRLEERVQSPYDGADAFGSLWDESDDWIDLGRRLGDVALHNAAVDLCARLAEAMGGADVSP